MPRLELSGVVLKPSGSGYGVGVTRPRLIGGRRTEEFVRPCYLSRPRAALTLWCGRVEAECEENPSGDDARLLAAILDAGRYSVLAVPGAVVRRRREVSGMSRRELARRSGVSCSTIRDIERGIQTPKTDTMLRLMMAMEEAR